MAVRLGRLDGMQRNRATLAAIFGSLVAVAGGCAPARMVAVTRPAAAIRPSTNAAPQPQAAARCHNSYDARCGPFRWAVPPGPNAPMTVRIYLSKRDVQIGEPVRISWVIDDPDAPLGCGDVYDFGTDGVAGGHVERGRTRYGPWDPPRRQRGYEADHVIRTYDKPGTFTIRIERDSGSCVSLEPNPYASEGKGTAVVRVHDYDI